MKLALPSGPYALDRVRIMGILNITPDSFYDGGKYARLDSALRRAAEMAEEGADLIDVGGERAGPGEPVSIEEEIARVVPVIERLVRDPGLPVSVDTFKPAVARAAVAAGAQIINGIGGFVDPEMIAVAADGSAAIVIMHIKGLPRVANPYPVYRDVVGEIQEFLQDRVSACTARGIDPERIIIDPGPGFGKTARHDLLALHGISTLTALPYPVLLAVSRKKVVGEVLGGHPDDRLEGSLAVAAWGVSAGVRLVRTHDVAATLRVCRMTEALLDPNAAIL